MIVICIFLKDIKQGWKSIEVRGLIDPYALFGCCLYRSFVERSQTLQSELFLLLLNEQKAFSFSSFCSIQGKLVTFITVEIVQSSFSRACHYSVIFDVFPEVLAHNFDIIVKLTASHEVLMRHASHMLKVVLVVLTTDCAELVLTLGFRDHLNKGKVTISG